jgi:hypothetical protein
MRDGLARDAACKSTQTRRAVRAAWAVALMCATVLLPQSGRAQTAPAGSAEAIRVSQDLEAKLTPYVGQVLDLVELGTGSRFVRPTLQGMSTRLGEITAIRLVPEGLTGVKSVRLVSISRIMAGRETLYEAPKPGNGRATTFARRQRELYEEQLRESAERMQARGVEPWPTLSSEEHAQEVEQLKAFVQEVRGAFPALELVETHEFLVATDILPEQVSPFVASLDSMHDFLCTLYGIPQGEPVWKGKCLVFAFTREEDFQAFEGRFMQTQPQGVHGLCHQRSDGRVVMACFRGNDPAAFAHMLVHETSHGFNHRWLSPARIPSWLNEGLAEWVGSQVVPGSGQIRLKELQAFEAMQAGGRVGENFFDDDQGSRIAPLQYGVASSLVRFLVTRDRKRFAQFIQLVKEGTPADEALTATYRSTLDELLVVYGRAIGVPNLTR